MKAVILAAGRGERLFPYTKKKPKPLVPLVGKPLIQHVVEAFKKAGIEDVVVVTGYMSQAVREFFAEGEALGVRIRYAHNPLYTRGNATSLKAAERHLPRGEAFLLSMADHVFDPSNVEKALEEAGEELLLCVDRRPRYLLHLEEATKVLVDKENCVRRIGKELSRWNGVDTGLFLLDPRIFRLIAKAMGGENPLTITYCMKRLIKEDALWACDVSGSFWMDVDTWKDLEHARRVMKDEEAEAGEG